MRRNPAATALVLPGLLAILAAVLVWLALTGSQLPIASSPRATLIVLFLIGIAMCGLGGISQPRASGRWKSSFAITGYVFGALILYAFVGVLAGLKIPAVADDHKAIVVISVLMAVKYVIGTAGYLLRLG